MMLHAGGRAQRVRTRPRQEPGVPGPAWRQPGWLRGLPNGINTSIRCAASTVPAAGS